jgi:hypothetical protein
MNLRKLLKQAMALTLLTAAAVANAGQIITTNSLEFIAPTGWVVDLSTKPVQVKGPAGELLQFSSYNIPSENQGAEANTIRAEVEANAVLAMESIAAEPPLSIMQPLKSTVLSNGVLFQEIASQSSDGKLLLTQFSMFGPHAAVLVTLDTGISSASSIEAVRSALLATKWVQ